jgi:hypothetical protein
MSPVARVCCELHCVSNPTRINRQIRNTQHLSTPKDGITIPTDEEEELWMKLSTTCSCPAGSVLLRDNRAWHGGTPNLSQFTRAIPSTRYTLQSPDEKKATIGI